MGKIEEKKRRKKDALFNTSFELFTTKGFHKTSISDIVEHAGVAKGTFYLYFKDKLDIQNKLISYKSNILFEKAYLALMETDLIDFSDRLIFIVDYIIDLLTKDNALLRFISKNLSWGVFKNALTTPNPQSDIDFYSYYMNMVEESPLLFRDPEVMLFLIIELVGSTAHSSILNKEPLPIDLLKPHLYDTIRSIIHLYTSTANT